MPKAKKDELSKNLDQINEALKILTEAEKLAWEMFCESDLEELYNLYELLRESVARIDCATNALSAA